MRERMILICITGLFLDKHTLAAYCTRAKQKKRITRRVNRRTRRNARKKNSTTQHTREMANTRKWLSQCAEKKTRREISDVCRRLVMLLFVRKEKKIMVFRELSNRSHNFFFAAVVAKNIVETKAKNARERGRKKQNREKQKN